MTVAALALPSAMAFAELAGVPVSAGLYALLLPVLAYAIFGSARQVVIGPEGTVALLVATTIAPLAAAGSAEYAALAAMLALLVGLVFFAARLMRLGWIADYFSQAVLVGYITGVALVLILGQLGKLVGISSDKDGAIRQTFDILRRLDEANGATVVVAVLALGLLVAAARISRRIPGALVLVVLAIAASQELLALGFAQLSSGVTQGLPVGTSGSRTAVNDDMGAGGPPSAEWGRWWWSLPRPVLVVGGPSCATSAQMPA